MNWKEVSVKLNKIAVEAAVNIIQELGAEGVIFDPGTDNKMNITAYYPANFEFSSLYLKLKQRINKLDQYNLDTGKIVFKEKDVQNNDWATSWHQYFKPIEAGKKFLIAPSWEKLDHQDRIVIEIDPGMAFGVGSHETTNLSIQIMEKYIDKNIFNMLDIGTGTGILAIAAAKLGVKKILGVDISTAAVEAARKNIIINGVEDFVEIKKGDMTTEITEKYSLVTANLLPNLILNLIPTISKVMKKETLLILSGIVYEKKKAIINCLKKYHLRVIEEKGLNDWLSLAVVKE